MYIINIHTQQTQRKWSNELNLETKALAVSTITEAEQKEAQSWKFKNEKNENAQNFSILFSWRWDMQIGEYSQNWNSHKILRHIQIRYAIVMKATQKKWKYGTITGKLHIRLAHHGLQIHSLIEIWNVQKL